MENLREIQIKLRRDRSDVVKVGFSSTYQYVGTDDKNLRCHVAIGNNIVNILQWKAKDFINVFETDREGVLVLKNTNLKGKMGNSIYKLRIVPRSFSHIISIPFAKDVDDKKIRTVPHEVIEMEDGQKCLKVFIGDDK